MKVALQAAPLIEICAYSVESSLAAQIAGADRIELCADPRVDGTTPSRDDMVRACKQIHIPLHVMVRPRGGDFVYSSEEFAQMKADTVFARELGVDGLVTGILLPSDEVDVERCRELVVLALPRPVT